MLYGEAKAAYYRKRHASWRNNIISKLGGVCIKCGFSDVRALQVDHIKGNGYAERKYMSHHTVGYYRAVMQDKGENYQLLCANCNWIKRYEQNECRGSGRKI